MPDLIEVISALAKSILRAIKELFRGEAQIVGGVLELTYYIGLQEMGRLSLSQSY